MAILGGLFSGGSDFQAQQPGIVNPLTGQMPGQAASPQSLKATPAEISNYMTAHPELANMPLDAAKQIAEQAVTVQKTQAAAVPKSPVQAGINVNGLVKQNQSTVDQQQALATALAGGAASGIQNQQNIAQQQQALGQQLQNIASGQGPNPAQAMLNQQTSQNVANQAALMAGQRGAGANAGLIARQAAQQGANTQQQAVGQGATLQAQQSLGALGQLGQNQVNQANLANTQIGQQQSALGQLGQLGQNQQNALFGANNALNQANISNAAQANQAQAGLEQQKLKGQQDFMGNLTGALGSAAGLLGAGAKSGVSLAGMGSGSEGLTMPKLGSSAGFAHGGEISKTAQSTFGKAMFARGGKVPAMVSPGEVYLNPHQVKQVQEGQRSPLRGERIQGQAQVAGDSLKNDTVPKTLTSGGIVLPRSVTQAKDAPQKAAAFVAAILAKQNIRSKKK